MYYQLLHYFGFLPNYLETIILIAIAIIVVSYSIIAILVKKMSFSLYFPAILLTVSHMCERLVRYIGNDIENEKITISTILLAILFYFAVKNVLNTSSMFAGAIGLIIFASNSQENTMLFTFFVNLALIFLIITIIKSIGYKDFKQVILCIIAIALDLATFNVKSNYLLNFLIAILFLYKLITWKTSSINKLQTILYIIIFAIITYFYGPLFALECILIIEQSLLCIKAKSPISLIVILLGSFLAFWAYSCIFMNDIAVALLILAIFLIIKLYLRS